MKKIVNLLIFVLVILADRLSKALALKTLSYTPLPVCYGFNLLLTWNRGISWSLFATDKPLGFWILTACIIATIICFAVYTANRAAHGLDITCEMLVLGGAVSNAMIDRLWYGAVLDFIELYIGSWYWPVFNIADSFIFFGIVGILIRTWMGRD